MVEIEGLKGKITGVHYFEGDCRLHEVSMGSEIRSFFYPCDYWDGKILFVEEKNKQTMNTEWESPKKVEDAYKVRNA